MGDDEDGNAVTEEGTDGVKVTQISSEIENTGDCTNTEHMDHAVRGHSGDQEMSYELVVEEETEENTGNVSKEAEPEDGDGNEQEQDDIADHDVTLKHAQNIIVAEDVQDDHHSANDQASTF